MHYHMKHFQTYNLLKLHLLVYTDSIPEHLAFPLLIPHSATSSSQNGTFTISSIQAPQPIFYDEKNNFSSASELQC